MSDSDLDRLTVLGGGVLGGQIAWHSAHRGKTVTVYDPSEDAIGRCRAAHDGYAAIYRTVLGASDAEIAETRARLSFGRDLADAVSEADIVIESVPEIPEIKAGVYAELARSLPARTIIATNSSTPLPRDFAALTGRPEKYCALHFANQIWSFNIVEIMAHAGTSQATLEAVAHFAIEIGQVPVAVQKERNGYLLNSWLVPMLNASLALVSNGVATPEDVDRTFLVANRGAGMGPFGWIDVIGVKTAHDVSVYWGEVNDDAQLRKNAAFIRENYLDKGLSRRLGGEGFYTYPDPAFARPDFLDVPDASAAPGIARRASLAIAEPAG
ncbi:3-hydroxyacyl-CoA dehydrogenase [Amaricoccus sp. W119]|uniref:3-hydroxyacyl-CoA dehydrogenase n=1 Tax=Amaricoccus sp. W119 TaxID=3391833 RepID=UPI0039A6E7C8